MSIWPFGKKVDGTEQFWLWFAENASHLSFDSPQSIQKSSETIAGQLAKANRELTCGVTLSDGTTPHTLEICADGISARIPLVEKFVAAAPSIPGWKVVAFRQPSKEPIEIHIGDDAIWSDTLLYSENSRSEGKINLTLYVPLPPNVPTDALAQIGFICLDHTVGEYRVMTKLGKIDFAPAQNAPLSSKTLKDLASDLGVAW